MPAPSKPKKDTKDDLCFYLSENTPQNIGFRYDDEYNPNILI